MRQATTSRLGEQAERQTDETRACDRCGRDRPADTGRFTVTASDFTGATADYERALLCGQCWQAFIDDLRRSIA